MNHDELAAAVDANYWESFVLLANACGGAVLEREDVLAVSSGLPVAMLNIGFVKQRLADPEGSIRAMVDFYDAAGLPYVLRVREGVDPSAEEAMAAMGMPYSETVPGMAMFPVADPPAPVSGLEIEVVRDDRDLARYQEVAAAGFGMPIDLVKQLLGPGFLEVPGFESYLGLMDGGAVATSSLYVGGNVSGVYNVATLDSHRRRGIGAAMTWRAIKRGSELGCTASTLEASPMGKPVYERMGFRTVAPYRTFHRPDKEGS